MTVKVQMSADTFEQIKKREHESGVKDERFRIALAIISLMDQIGMDTDDRYFSGLLQVLAIMYVEDNDDLQV